MILVVREVGAADTSLCCSLSLAAEKREESISSELIEGVGKSHVPVIDMTLSALPAYFCFVYIYNYMYIICMCTCMQ